MSRIAPKIVATLVVALVAGSSPAVACQPSLYEAAAKYAFCDLRFFGKLYNPGFSIDVAERLVAKCRRTYAVTWPKLVAKYGAQNPACSGPRFLASSEVVADQLTGLLWEQKTDDGSIHDVDNQYTWSDGVSGSDGTVFTTFLPTLNASCFAGFCDWRLPTRSELQTIMPDAYPCSGAPCIDPAFTPTASAFYWSSSTNPTGDGFVYGVQFATGVFGVYPKAMLPAAVRAVRNNW